MKDSSVSRSRAVALLLDKATPGKTLHLPPEQAVGLVPASPIASPAAIPEHPCSLRDGFAVRSTDIRDATPGTPVQLLLGETVRAETTDPPPLKGRCAMRVLTGGLLPEGADCVVAEEDATDKDGTLFVENPIEPGWFVRDMGGELPHDALLAQAGKPLTPQAAAVMVRAGVSTVPVHPAPRARILALGSELTRPGDTTGKGRFPADNIVLTTGMAERYGTIIESSDVLPDDLEEIVSALTGPDLPELILTTGGTGRSERDFARKGAEEAGFSILFDGVAIRPGKNVFAAVREGTILLSMPGPPAAVFACFHALGLPMIDALSGLHRPVRRGVLTEPISVRPGFDWLLPCQIEQVDAATTARPLFGKQAPPLLSLAHAHGVIVLPGGTDLAPGETVELLGR